MEQDHDQEIARLNMGSIGGNHPLAGPVLKIHTMKNLASMQETVQKALNVVHKINSKAKPSKRSFIRKIIPEERLKAEESPHRQNHHQDGL